MRRALIAVWLLGCDSVQFARPSQVDYARQIALVVDPPVFRPGDVLSARALVVTPEGEHLLPDGEVVEADGERSCSGNVCFEWAVCLRPERSGGLNAVQYNPSVPSQACTAMGEGTLGSALTVDEEGTLFIDTSPLRTALDLGAISMVAEAVGIPDELAAEIIGRTGIPIIVELRVFAEGEVFVGYKRVLMLDDGCTDDCPGRNPPAPQLGIRLFADDAAPMTFVTGRGVAPFECVPCARAADGSCVPDGSPLVLAADKRYLLSPDEDIHEWAEPYTVLSLAGELETLQEQGYFAFYTTAGHMQQQDTRYPAAEEIFRSPAELGEHTFWVVARDGHYGVSACRVRYRVE